MGGSARGAEAPETPLPILVVGPTASGKSDLALDLAEHLEGEVVNSDAFQIYRGMDIGTAKVPVPERRGIPHHLLDICDIDHAVTVAEFQSLARAAISDVASRGRVPVVVGGSGLYVRAIVDDLRFPGTDAAVRAELEADLDRSGPHTLHERLAAVDPAAARLINPGNGRRIVRALEVIRITGEPFAASMPDAASSTLLPHVQLGIDIDRGVMDGRIDRRVDRMWAEGLLGEVVRLEAEGLRDAPTAGRALGYSQALAHLDDAITVAEAIEQTAKATRAFARRQQRWFRQDSRVRWVPSGAPLDEVLGAMELGTLGP